MVTERISGVIGILSPPRAAFSLPPPHFPIFPPLSFLTANETKRWKRANMLIMGKGGEETREEGMVAVVGKIVQIWSLETSGRKLGARLLFLFFYLNI